MAGMRAALPDLTEADVIGSPYCVRDYVVDPRFGELAVAREALAARGLKLILDYVPNHVAPDHPWVPEHCIRGSEDDLARDPGVVAARGRRDRRPRPRPVLPGLAGRRPARRVLARAAGGGRATLLARLAEQCDGVRCDMAMLMTSEVFARTWQREPPADGVLARSVIKRRPEFVHRRGLLGHGVRAAAAGLRLRLRQAALRPAVARGRRGRPRPPGAPTPTVPAALHREPRRAARGGRVRGAGAGGGGDPRHRAGRQALPRRPARGRPRAHPGLPRARPARAARPRPVGVLRPAAADRAAARTGGCSRPTTRSCWRGRSTRTSSRSTSARPRPGAASTCASTARSPTC